MRGEIAPRRCRGSSGGRCAKRHRGGAGPGQPRICRRGRGLSAQWRWGSSKQRPMLHGRSSSAPPCLRNGTHCDGTHCDRLREGLASQLSAPGQPGYNCGCEDVPLLTQFSALVSPSGNAAVMMLPNRAPHPALFPACLRLSLVACAEIRMHQVLQFEVRVSARKQRSVLNFGGGSTPPASAALAPSPTARSAPPPHS
jgi:hypothetical protein